MRRLVNRVLEWFHAPYPPGVNPREASSLVVLAPGQVTDTHLRKVLAALEGGSPYGSRRRITRVDIAEAFLLVTDRLPLLADLESIELYLRRSGRDVERCAGAGGWPAGDEAA
ncbi:MAG: DUF3349 domain-containing protein [Actinomycetales bacterium]|nr:DUF3349 domain-containing protein [Actinomycetales bacterium]